MKISLHKPEFGEDARGVLQAVMTMPPDVRYKYYQSAEGRDLLKGMNLLAENDKTPAEALGDKREWDKKEIDDLIQQLNEASPEQKEIIFALLPGPVIGIVMNRLASTEGRTRSEDARVEGETDEIEKGIRGPVKGTSGYFQWLERLKASRAAKRAVTDAAKKSPSLPATASTKPAVKPSDKKKVSEESADDSKSGKKDYKHFVRKVSDKAEIKDKPSGEKE